MKESYFTPTELKAFKESESSPFTYEQIMGILIPTPKEYIKIETNEDSKKEYKYVEGSYVKQRLNFLFSFGWNFKIISEENHNGEIVVKGKLKLPNKNGGFVSRTQFGKQSTTVVQTQSGTRTIYKTKDIGNAYKSAATDCLKKCASEFGFFWDIYQQEEEIKVVKESPIDKLDHSQKAAYETASKFLNKCKTKHELEELIIQLSEGTTFPALELLIEQQRKRLK